MFIIACDSQEQKALHQSGTRSRLTFVVSLPASMHYLRTRRYLSWLLSDKESEPVD